MIKQVKSKGSLSDRAYKMLKNEILMLDLKPGQMLNEEELSERLGISRTPLRGALQRLDFESLVKIVPSKGTYVTELSIDYFLDLFALREAIEILSVKLAALNRTDEQLKEIKSLVNKQLEMAQDKDADYNEYIKVDREIHVILSRMAKNVLVEKQILRINESYNRYLRFVGFRNRDIVVAREHIMIIDAIEKRDTILAQDIMKDHLRDVKESILVALITMNR